ncbi:MAG: VOC family protein [Planctomycetota bacterium]|nr:VOC family protein [Planctomycetota bacterium]
MKPTHHVLTVFAVTDVERSVVFYERAFGWTRRADFPVYVELALPDGRGVAFYERRGFGLNTGQEPPAPAAGALTGAELYLRCEDLDGVIERLHALGARMLRPVVRKDWGDDVAYFADPEGNVLAVARRALVPPEGNP